jgi:hypothetical protein
MRIRTLVIWSCCVVAAALLAPAASAKVMSIPDFAQDPSGPGFTISAIGPTEGRSSNITTAPALTFGATSVPDGTANCLQMVWEPASTSLDATAGWRLTFGSDPNLVNHVLALSICPPGGIFNGQFVGIASATIDILDINKMSCGAWEFNTDQMGMVPAGNDPFAAGGSSLLNNVMNTVVINLLNGPVAGSAAVSGFDRGIPPQPFNYIAPNKIFAPAGGNLAQAGFIDFYENGLLRGQVQIPGQGAFGPVNFWDHVSITPEPATLALLGFGALGVLSRRRRAK